MIASSAKEEVLRPPADDPGKIAEKIHTSSIIIDDGGIVLYSNRPAKEQFKIQAGEKVFLDVDPENSKLTLRSAQSIRHNEYLGDIFAVSHFTWQQQPAQLVILDGESVLETQMKDLLEKERMFKTLVSNMPGMAYRSKNDPTATMEYVSERCYELTGYPAEVVVRNHTFRFTDLILETDRDHFSDEIKTALAENRPYQILYRIRTKSGEVKWIWDQGRGIYNQQGELISREGLMIDTTERQIASEALLESESRYRSLIQASPDAVLLTDLQGRILLCNHQLCQMLGAETEHDLLGKESIDFIDYEIREKDIEEIQDSLSDAKPFVNLGSIISIDGKRIPIEANIAHVLDKSGRPNAYIAIVRDVSQREMDQRLIRNNEARYRAIVDDNPEMILRYQADETVTFANATFCQYYNLDPRALPGRQLTDALPEKAREVLHNLLDSIHPDMEPDEKEINLVNSAGETRWFRWITRPVVDADGQFIEYQSVGQDVTDQKKAEQSLRESESRLSDLLENVKLLALILDMHGNVNFCNSFYCEITGWKKENVIGQNWLDKFIPIDDSISFKKMLLESAITGSIPARYENLILTSHGEQRLIAWNNTILKDSHGSVTGLASIGQDITERNFSEKIQAGIYKISQVANQTNNLDELFERIHQVLEELMPVDNFFIALYDQENDVISFPYYIDQFDTAPEPTQPGRGLTEYVLRSGQSILVNPEVFNLLVEEGEVESIGTPSVDWLGVPLKVENHIIGVMGTQSYTEGIRYKKRDEQMFAFVSTQIAMAIDRKQAELALASSQKRNQLVVEASTDAILTQTLNGKIIDCNAVAEEMYGYSREELLERTFEDFVPDASKQDIPDFSSQQMEKNGFLMETINTRSDGSLFPVEISTRLMTIDEKPVVVIYVRDITERKQVEKAIVESEAKFRALAETAAAGIYIYRDDQFLYVNPKWCQITGFSEEELLQKNFYELFPEPLDREKQIIHFSHTEGDPSEEQFEKQITTHEGKKRWVDITAGSIEFNEKAAIVGTAVDITERKQREHELQVIAQISETIRLEVTRNEVLPAILEQLLDLLNVDGALISTFENGDTSTILDRGIGCLKLLDGISISSTEGLAGYILSTGKPYVNHEASKDPHFAFPEILQSSVSIAGVPLISPGRTIGALVVCAAHHLEEFEINLLAAIGDMIVSALHRSDLHEQTLRQTVELQKAYESTLEGWALALELRDKETQGHSLRIANLTVKLARRMGIPEERIEIVRRGALLHDIGKMGIPDTVLLKPGTLTDAEWKIMRRHPTYARDMLTQIPFFSESVDIPYCHHEWWDGSGYPQGLEGKEIPLEARIFAIVDSWDALTSNRPYRKAWQRNEALAHLVNQAGTHFDPDVVDAFVKLIREEQF